MKIYIAGPMRGYEQLNFPAFDSARDRLKKKGWEVISPADLDREKIGFDATKGDTLESTNFDMRQAVKRDIDALADCDAIYMLIGYEESYGAGAELACAEWLGLDVTYESYDVLGPILTGDFQNTLPQASVISEDEAQQRKDTPVFSGVLNYFPEAIADVARCSKVGNDQHNPGKPLHWDRSKSGDELDALTRHLIQAGTTDTDGIRHSTKVAWRALANLQKELERDGWMA